MPSPSMSPVSGTSPRSCLPHCSLPAVALLKPLAVVSHDHAPVDPRQSARSALPSPSMSGSGDSGEGSATKTHAAPGPPGSPESSKGPPTIAVAPSPESETERPCAAPLHPEAPEPTSFGPRCVQTPPLFVQSQTAPFPPSSADPPTMAVLPSAERETETPCAEPLTAPDPTSLGPCWLQTPPLLCHTHTAPSASLPGASGWLSSGPPTMAVFPSADSDTEYPCPAVPIAPEPTSLGPCWVQIPPLRDQTHAAPTPFEQQGPAGVLSRGPPTMAVLPSAESDTEIP